jgi:hypothetical protein
LSAVGRDYLACGAARKRDICSNMASIRRSQLEQLVIDALRANLMEPDDVWEFVDAFTAEWNRLAAEANAERSHDKTRLATIQRKIERIVEAITEGYRTPEMKALLETLNAQKTTLRARMASPVAATPSLHPNLGELYRAKVAALHEELSKSNGDNTAVLEALRDLIERVEFGPSAAGDEPEITLMGALASMVGLGLGHIIAEEHDMNRLQQACISRDIQIRNRPGFFEQWQACPSDLAEAQRRLRPAVTRPYTYRITLVIQQVSAIAIVCKRQPINCLKSGGGIKEDWTAAPVIPYISPVKMNFPLKSRRSATASPGHHFLIFRR